VFRYPKIPHLTIDTSKELGRGAFGIVHLVNNMQVTNCYKLSLNFCSPAPILR
jgi:hypothetical protein